MESGLTRNTTLLFVDDPQLKLRGKHARSYFVAGVLLLLVGSYLAIYSSAIPPHMKIYFSVTQNSVTILEVSPEFAIPLAGVQPYIQNLTSGNRTLIATVSDGSQTLLNETYPGVGIGYQLWRTGNLVENPPSGTDVRVTLKIVQGASAMNEAQDHLVWSQDYYYISAGIISALTGVVFVLTSLGKRPLKRTRTK